MSKILLDVDGVLNPFLAGDLQERGFSPLDAGWAIWMLHHEHGVWLREIAEYAELVWATSWEEEAQKISALFGLPELDVIHFTAPPLQGTWKLPDVKLFLENTCEPVVWLDDEFENDADEWAAERGNTLLIACDPAIGFTREQASQVLGFLDSNRF